MMNVTKMGQIFLAFDVRRGVVVHGSAILANKSFWN